MKINSIQFKFLLTVLIAMQLISVCVGSIGIYETDAYARQQTETLIKVTCEKEAAQMNDIFGDMEKSVNIMSGYVLDFLENADNIQSAETQQEIIRNARRMFADVANYTNDAVAYYLRFAPEIADGQTGFFCSKVAGSNRYFYLPATNISRYDKSDTERVGWYWQPYEAGKPVWMQPYYNKNNGIMMISYVVPLYCDNQFVGVVGMDFNYSVLNDKVNSIKIYENGFAHLEYDGIPIHYDESISSAYPQEHYLQVSEELVNGMTLTLSASKADIRQIRYEIATQIVSYVLALMVVFCLITGFMVQKMVKPLSLLTDAAKKLADGDYNVEPVKSDTYEIQMLSAAFENMTQYLLEHERHQYLLAHIDAMTGLRNTTSYNLWVDGINQEIEEKNADFGIIVLDINNLKETNDRYGHDVGNNLIVAAGQILSSVFQGNTIFRIGGDEFLVVLQHKALKNHKVLCRKLDLRCAKEHILADGKCVSISIARGFAKYDPDTDEQFVDVFNRADDAMYKNKKKIKSLQKHEKNFREKDKMSL